MEIMLVSFVPNYCAGCGASLKMGRYSIHDFLAHSAFHCTCGVCYQYVNRDTLLETAQTVGDMKESD